MEEPALDSKRRPIFNLMVVLATLLLVFVAYKAIRLYPIASRIRLHSQNLVALREISPKLLLNTPALEGAQADLAGLGEALVDLERATSTELQLLSGLDWVPAVGGDLAAVPVLVKLGISGAATGEALIAAVLPAVQLEEQKPLAEWATGGGGEVITALSQGQPDFERTLDGWTETAVLLQQLDELPRGQLLGPRLDHYLDRIRPLVPLADAGLEAAAHNQAVLDAALGLSRPRRYLVLLQNSWEMRATGGFISAAVVLTMTGGKFETSEFLDSYIVDRDAGQWPQPPESLLTAMWAGIWTFRDSNWSADFPTSARLAEQLFEAGGRGAVDGTVALDPALIQYLLAAMGPVSVAEHATAVTAENLWEQMIAFHSSPAESQTAQELIDSPHNRKDFLPQVALPLLAGLRSSLQNPGTALSLVGQLQQALEEKHLLVAMRDEQAAGWLQQHGWDGSLWQGPGDYLQVVDSNVGYNKADVRVEREIAQRVTLLPAGQAMAQTNITYTNNSQMGNPSACVQGLIEGGYQGGWVDACYWNYVRVYVPAGSQLIAASPSQWPADSLWRRENPYAGDPGVLIGPEEGGKQVFGLMLAVLPGETRTVSFQYLLPAGTWTSQQGYQLYIQKQSGTIGTPVQVTVIPAEGMALAGATSHSPEGFVTLQFALVKDTPVSLTLSGAAVQQLAGRPAITLTPTASPTLLPSPTPWPTWPPNTTPTPVTLLVTATPTDPAPTLQPATLTWTSIRVPKAHIDGAIVEVGWKLVGPPEARRAEWEVAAYAAGHHKDSAYPGETGNVVLSGHHNILGEVFRDLWTLEPGDDIYLTDSAGTVYHYVTREVNLLPTVGVSAEVAASYLAYIQQKHEPILTLVTCWPYETNTHRTIVVADLAH